MRIITHLDRSRLKNLVIALGNFDGVHIGHKRILQAAVKYAKKAGLISAAMTFDPHPQQVVSPERGLRLLSTLAEREEMISALGVDELVVIKFTKGVKKLTCDQFVKRYLIDKFGVRKVFVGFDYAFGRGRAGNVAHLRDLGRRFGFGVEVVPAVTLRGRAVKSERIRGILSAGKFKEALRMLGHPYTIRGRVVRGAGRGRRLGFPTANLAVDAGKLIPSQGVYAGVVLVGGEHHKCVVNIGGRPTFPGDGGAVEVHVINFNGNIRGKVVRVDLLERFRDELQFSDVLDLRKQIKRDVMRASRGIKI